MRKPKYIMAGIRQRGQRDIIGFRGNEWELEVQVKKDAVVDSGEPIELELCGLGAEPFEESEFVVVEVRSLEDVKVPLVLLSVSQRVVDVASNGGLW